MAPLLTHARAHSDQSEMKLAKPGCDQDQEQEEQEEQEAEAEEEPLACFGFRFWRKMRIAENSQCAFQRCQI